MANGQAAITQTMAQTAVGSVKAVVQAMATDTGERCYGLRSDPTIMGPKLCRPTLTQPIFDWGSADKIYRTQKLHVKSK